jgi:Flp pilus assembly protein protease CpaA
MNFIFLIYFFGILLACFQDVKRREVDDWLNLSIFFAGTFFLIFNNISSSFPIGSYGLFVFLIALISFLLYNARFFAGGDAKILFSLSPLFYDFFFFKSIENFLTFFVFLIFAGAIYGLGFIFVLSIKNFYSLKKEFIINFRKLVYLKYLSYFY